MVINKLNRKALLIASAILIGANAFPDNQPKQETELVNKISLAEQITNSLSYEEKVNQLIIVPADYALEHLDENFGGVIYCKWHLQGNYNTFPKLQNANTTLKNKPVKPLINLDLEGGTVKRLKFVQDFEDFLNQDSKDMIMEGINNLNRDRNGLFELPSQEEIFKAYLEYDDKEEFLKGLERYAYGIAETLDRAGFNQNLAPVLAVVPNIESRIYHMALYDRNFGNDVEIAKKLSEAYIKGFNSYKSIDGTGILATAKHFPGKGFAKEDPHGSKTIVDKNLEELVSQDIEVFKEILDNVPAIMFSQATYPAIDNIHPATVSVKMRDYLISELGFKGIIVSDDIIMASLNDYEREYNQDRFKNMAKACDMVLSVLSTGYYNNNIISHRKIGQKINLIEKIRAGIREALTEQEINERVTKIIDYKIKYGLINTNNYD